MPLDYTAPHTPIYARDPASKPILLDGALEGHVLVKNENALPLKSPKLLSIFGYDAVAPPDMDIASPSDLLDPFTYGFEPILGFNAFFSSSTPPAIAINGTMISGGKAVSHHSFPLGCIFEAQNINRI
jgi:beta-glucosidase